MNILCVVWNREANLLEMCPIDTLLQLNNASFLDDKPPRAVLRMGLSRAEALQFIFGFQGVMHTRQATKAAV